METPELPGPWLREGKVEPGSVPNARRPGPGSGADKSKCSSIPSPSLRAPAYPMASGTRLLLPRGHELRSVISSRVSATSRRVRTLGRDPKAVVERWAPRVLQPSLPFASRVSSRRGCPTTTGGGLWVCRRCLGPVTAGACIRDGGCCRGARNWGRRVCVRSAGSAGVKGSLLWGCALAMGAHSSVILFTGRWQRVFRWD